MEDRLSVFCEENELVYGVDKTGQEEPRVIRFRQKTVDGHVTIFTKVTEEICQFGTKVITLKRNCQLDSTEIFSLIKFEESMENGEKRVTCETRKLNCGHETIDKTVRIVPKPKGC